MELRTIEWKNDSVVMIDQTKLPNELVFVKYTDYNDVADAIRTLIIRGAPAIGVSGAFGMALAVLQSSSDNKEGLLSDLEKAKKILFDTRPTAVNLSWALGKIMQIAKQGKTVSEIRDGAIAKAKQMAEEDININKKMGKNGVELFQNNDTIMTHCNAGALATVAYGTALGVIRATKDSGKNIKVIATETRPVQQGSRLTTFELKHDGIDVSLIPDTAVGYTMANGLVNRVIVGADRILRTGHLFNKIGTYQVATIAKRHNIPFYVAAPLSTFDLKSNPENVIIEQRKASEVTGVGDKKTAPDGVNVINPAFDMTPPELISGIITENGVVISKAGLITLTPSGAVFLSPTPVTSLAFLCSIITFSGLLLRSNVDNGAAT
jgi:methylthioribose-1-phosphate isomerase